MNDHEHYVFPEPLCINYRLALAVSAEDIFSDMIRSSGKCRWEGQVLSHPGCHKARLDGQDFHAALRKPVPQSGKVSGESGFGGAVYIIAHSSTIARDGAYADYRTALLRFVILAGRNTDLLLKDAADLRLRYNVNAEAVIFDAVDFNSHAGFWNSLSQKPSAVVCVFGYLGDQKVSEKNWDEARKTIDTNFTARVCE